MRDFETATDNAGEAWNRFSSNIQNKAEQIGSRFLPAITDAMNHVSEAMETAEARRTGEEKVTGGDWRIGKNTRDQFLKEYKAELEKEGVGNPKRTALAGKAWEEALAKYGANEIANVFQPIRDMQDRRRNREAYLSGKARASVGRHSAFLGISTNTIPVPGSRADNLPAEPGSARWLQERYGYGTGRERVGDSAARLEAEREKNRPPFWKRFLFGAAADDNFDVREHMGIKLRPSGAGNAGKGFASGVEEGGRKAEHAMDASARKVEQIADSVNTYDAGKKAGDQFAAGLAASADAVAAAANKALVNPVANRVPQSPAKIGPLRNLPSMGRKIAQQLAGGMEGEKSPVQAAAGIARKIASASAAGGKDAGAGAAAPVGRQIAGIQIGQISISGVKDAAEAADSIGIELERRLAGTLADVG